jgi:predicted permease
MLIKWMPLVPGGAEPGDLRPLALNMSPDARLFAFFLAVSVCTAMLTSLAPIWRLSRNDLNLLLKTPAGEKRHRRLQTVLCALQVAFCSVLLVSALLSYRTISKLRAANPGFDAAHVVTFSIDPGMRHYDAARAWSFRQRLLAGARAVPEVKDAALSGMPLMRGIGLVTSLRMPGQQTADGFNTSMNVVSDRYFDAMGIGLLSGRDFQPQDADLSPEPIIVNVAFAHRFFGNNNVVGQFAGVIGDGRPQYQIVGLVSDTHYRSMREIPPPVFYQPFLPRQAANRFLLEVRTTGPPDSMAAQVREVVRSIDPGMPVYQASTLAEEINRSLWQERLTMGLASSFAIAATILSVVGLYGMLAYFVIQHCREIGVRIAIGATTFEIVYLVSRKTLASVVGGLLAGAFLFAAAARSIQAILYGVDAVDRILIGQTLILITGISAAATLIPSLRAVRVDPAQALRNE